MESDNKNILNSPALGHRKVCDVGSAILMRSVFFTDRMLQNVTVIDEESPNDLLSARRKREGQSQKSRMDPIEEVQENSSPLSVEQSAGALLSRIFALQAALPHQNPLLPPPAIPLSKPSAQGLTPSFQEEQALLSKENGQPFSPGGKPQSEPLHRAPFLDEKARQETAILNGEPKKAGVLHREAGRTTPNPQAPLSKPHDPTPLLIQAPERIDPASSASAQITPVETAPVQTHLEKSQAAILSSAPKPPPVSIGKEPNSPLQSSSLQDPSPSIRAKNGPQVAPEFVPNAPLARSANLPHSLNAPETVSRSETRFHSFKWPTLGQPAASITGHSQEAGQPETFSPLLSRKESAAATILPAISTREESAPPFDHGSLFIGNPAADRTGNRPETGVLPAGFSLDNRHSPGYPTVIRPGATQPALASSNPEETQVSLDASPTVASAITQPLPKSEIRVANPVSAPATQEYKATVPAVKHPAFRPEKRSPPMHIPSDSKKPDESTPARLAAPNYAPPLVTQNFASGRIPPVGATPQTANRPVTAPLPTQPIVSQVGKMASAPAIPAANQIATPLLKSVAPVVPSASPSALVERAKLIEKGTVVEEQASSAEGEFQVVVHEQPFVIIDNYFGVGRV